MSIVESYLHYHNQHVEKKQLDSFQSLLNSRATLARYKSGHGKKERNEKLWDEMFELLVKYKEENGHTMVPWKYKVLA